MEEDVTFPVTAAEFSRIIDSDLSSCPAKKRKGQTKESALSNGAINVCSTNRVTRMSSGVITRKTVFDMCKSAIQMKTFCQKKSSVKVDDCSNSSKNNVDGNEKTKYFVEAEKLLSTTLPPGISTSSIPDAYHIQSISENHQSSKLISTNLVCTDERYAQQSLVENTNKARNQTVAESCSKQKIKVNGFCDIDEDEDRDSLGCSENWTHNVTLNEVVPENQIQANSRYDESQSVILTQNRPNQPETICSDKTDKTKNICAGLPCHGDLVSKGFSLEEQYVMESKDNNSCGLDIGVSLPTQNYHTREDCILNNAIKPLKLGPRNRQDFRCRACKLRFFATEDELKVHMECHFGKAGDPEYYRCKLCPYSVPSWSRMLSHIIIHSEYKERLADTRLTQNILGKFSCPECGQSFERKVNMQGHLKKVHFKESHTCDQCGVTFQEVDRKTFVRHQEKCRNVKIQCSHCEYSTTVKSNMQKHMKVHNGEGFTCSTCFAVFPTRQRYQMHLLTHQTDRPRYGCEYCGMMFVSEDSVKKHCVRFHQNVQRSIPCPHCPYTARINIDLKKHIQAVHEKKRKCTKCPYSTNSDHAFDQHQLYHSSDRIFACSVVGCFYRSTNAKQMAVHNAGVHHVTSKHQCPVCRKFYKKKTHLIRHLVSHTGDRPYICQECSQTFYSHSSYYRHRRRLGHDENREGVASVPQNITIQYVDDKPEEDCWVEDTDQVEFAESLGARVTATSEAVQVLPASIYEQLFQTNESLPKGCPYAKLELNSLLTDSSQDLLLADAKGDGRSSSVTYLVEVRHELDGSKQAYFRISEQDVDREDRDEPVGAAAANGTVGDVSSFVAPSGGKERAPTPKFALVMLPSAEEMS